MPETRAALASRRAWLTGAVFFSCTSQEGKDAQWVTQGPDKQGKDWTYTLDEGLGGLDLGALDQSVGDLVCVDTSQVDLGGGGNHVALADAGQGDLGTCRSNAQRMEQKFKQYANRTSNGEETRAELLHNDSALK